MMEDKNCALLFEYLRSILYDSKVKPLDLEALDEPYHKLGMGLQYLEQAVREMKAYSAALSTGNLNDCYPSRTNPLCENLKNIQANLNHLTWQAKQVAKGDYSQTVSYLGEFSEAFNTMTAQLKEREAALRREAQLEKEYADALEKEVSLDPLTQIGNRHSFNENLDKLLKTDSEFVFCFCDLDHLKYVNDTFGHAEATAISAGSPSWSSCTCGSRTFCPGGRRRILHPAQKLPARLSPAGADRHSGTFLEDSSPRYPQNFSFGLFHLPKGHGVVDPAELLHQADVSMYEQKKLHKQQ